MEDLYVRPEYRQQGIGQRLWVQVAKFIHMEDLYVRPEYRQQGIGQRLWVQVAKLAHDSGMKRLQWNVLEWNENAIRFYNKVSCLSWQ
uniref:N-acetyltransferase domain-containing protein n=1 Tax=Ascaris lumbricoides TaxID=6252 RepID=A0A0M3IPC8_ASCLU